MMRIVITRGRAVDCRAELTLALSDVSVWGQLRDFHRYACQDQFHKKIEIDGETPRAGAPIRLWHSHLGMQVERVGRILWWREGQGYSYSDLSRRGPRRGFPHVFSFRVRSIGVARSLLEIRVRGRWTLPMLPRWMARLWLRWVFWHVAIRVRNQLLMYEIARSARRKIATRCWDRTRAR